MCPAVAAMGFPGSLVGKESACSAGDLDLNLVSGQATYASIHGSAVKESTCNVGDLCSIAGL